MIVDVCTYNGEKDLWDLHYNALEPYVDQFVVVEFDRTFAGETKIFHNIGDFRHSDYPKAAFHNHFEDRYEQYRELAESSPNTQGASHWTTEFMMKESILDALTHLQDDDMVFVGDVDEIWDKKALQIKALPLKLKLDVYAYYLNNHSSEQFWGTLVAPYEVIKNSCLNHLRTRAPKSKKNLGWHFTSMAKDLPRKLTDSYTHESYATPEVLANVAYNIENNKDFLGRNFTYELTEAQWPPYLKSNRAKYLKLLKEELKPSPDTTEQKNETPNT